MSVGTSLDIVSWWLTQCSGETTMVVVLISEDWTLQRFPSELQRHNVILISLEYLTDDVMKYI